MIRRRRFEPVRKYFELIADRLSASGWSWGCVSAIDSNERTIWIADAHRDNGKRFVARNDEKLTAFLELERVTRESLRFQNAEQFCTILAVQPFAPVPLGRKEIGFQMLPDY